MAKWKEWKVKKVKMILNDQIAFKVITPKMIHDYEDYGYTEEDAKLMASSPKLAKAIREIEKIAFDAIDKSQDSELARQIAKIIKELK